MPLPLRSCRTSHCLQCNLRLFARGEAQSMHRHRTLYTHTPVYYLPDSPHGINATLILPALLQASFRAAWRAEADVPDRKQKRQYRHPEGMLWYWFLWRSCICFWWPPRRRETHQTPRMYPGSLIVLPLWLTFGAN